MHFQNSEGTRAAFVAGSRVCWNSTDGLMRYFSPSGALLEYVKDGVNEPTFDGVVDGLAAFHNRALAAARWFGMNIRPFHGAAAYDFIDDRL